MIGESQPGSWPIHTPFDTSAITVQPTEQCVQMFLRSVTAAPRAGGGPASALRTLPSGSAPTAASPPAREAGAAQEGAAVEAARSRSASAALSEPRRA